MAASISRAALTCSASNAPAADHSKKLEGTTTMRHRTAIYGAAAAALLGLVGCSAMQTPTAQSIQGLTPSGTVALTETFAAGYGGGSGTLTFNGQNYPFELIGAVAGPGGAERVTASGEVYKLTKTGDF